MTAMGRVAVIVLAALVVGAVQQVRVVNARLEVASVRAEMAALKAASIADARRIEQRWRARVDEIAAMYEQEKADAEETHARVVADLESGAARLRAHWEGCQATGELSAAAAAAASADDAAALRRAGAANLVRLADQCDAQVRGLQRAYGVIAE